MGIETFHGSIIAVSMICNNRCPSINYLQWARRARLFRPDEEPVPDLIPLDRDALDAAWKAWIRREEKQR